MATLMKTSGTRTVMVGLIRSSTFEPPVPPTKLRLAGVAAETAWPAIVDGTGTTPTMLVSAALPKSVTDATGTNTEMNFVGKAARLPLR
jgi:hypothetical protein